MNAPSPNHFRPRPPQARALRAIRHHWATRPHDGPQPLLNLATGVGKTATALSLVAEVAPPRRVLWLADRTELVSTQPIAAIRRFWPHLLPEVGVIQGSRDQCTRRITFASVYTLANEGRLEAYLRHGVPDLIVVDEAHLSLADSWMRVIDTARGPTTRMLGLTATPDREDGRDLGHYWEIPEGAACNIVEAVEGGFLKPPFAAVLPYPEFDAAVATDRMDGGASEDEVKKARVKHTTDHLANIITLPRVEAHRLPYRDERRILTAKGRRFFAFMDTAAECALLAQKLRERGLKARVISDQITGDERGRRLRALGDGRLDGLCSPLALATGIDVPEVSAVVIGRAMGSWSFFVQAVGRGLRLGAEDCLLLDATGATEAHSLVGAPVLISGAGCTHWPDGGHRYQADGERGVCECGEPVACWRLKGAHRYGEDGRCTACRTPACEARDGAHHWVEGERHKRMCVGCGLERPSSLGALNKRRPALITLEDLTRVDVADGVWGFPFGGIGVVIMARRPGYLRDLWWVTPDGRPTKMTFGGPVGKPMAHLLVESVAMRATRAPGQRYGERRGPGASRVVRAEVERAVREVGL